MTQESMFGFVQVTDSTFLSHLSLLIFMLSGLIIYLIGQRSFSRDLQLSRALTQGLWGFTPQYETKVLHENNLWNWRKLFMSGIMISSLLSYLFLKKIGIQKTMMISLGVLGIWTIFLIIFWYFAIVKDEVSNDLPLNRIPPTTPAIPTSTPSEGWLKKVKTSSTNDNRLPMTIITGFLGAGKTTLIKHLLSNTIGMKILVIENEIGQEGIDHELLLQQTGKEQIILLNNGCVCCTVRSDLIATFHVLFKQEVFSNLDWIIVETTGLADPAPVIQSLYMDRECNQRMRLDSVITVVDAKHIQTHIKRDSKPSIAAHGVNSIPEAIQQLAHADRIVLNKIDLFPSKESLVPVINDIRQINPQAILITTTQSAVSIEDILNIQSFNVRKYEKDEAEQGKEEEEVGEGGEGGEQVGKVGHANSSSKKSRNINITRGVFHIETDSEGKIILPSKKKKKRSPQDSDESVEEELVRAETIVGGGGGAGGGGGESSVEVARISTISLTTTKPINLNQFNRWISSFLKEKGNDIYRFKGILAMKGYDQKFVVQGIHMLFNGEVCEEWSVAEGHRRSKLVFIGVDLNHQDIKNNFEKCIFITDERSEREKKKTS